MADKSKIQWTEATWNPVRGCTRVSPGCGGPGPHGGCYAEGIAARFSGPGQPYHGFAEFRGGKPRWTGKLALIEHQLTLPLRWRHPRRIFVNSMSDLFHEALSDEAIDRVFAVMALCPQHRFQVLTKRAERMREYLSLRGRSFSVGLKAFNQTSFEIDWPLPNVWLGVSCERQQEADERLPDLRDTPAAIRFISFEPLLGHIDADLRDIRWAIVGGESGKDARPMHPDWARSLRDQCVNTGVPFFFKQWGEYLPVEGDGAILEAGRGYRRVGKARAGRLLDGQEWNQYPEAA